MKTINILSAFKFILVVFLFSIVIGKSEKDSDFDFKNFTKEKRIKDFKFAKQLFGISDTLNKILLSEDIISKTNVNFRDIRIFGFDKGTNNTQEIKNEIPYIINRKDENTKTKEINFKLLNQTKNNDLWYYTFEIGENIEINRLKLNFENENFDWKIDLEGSADNKNWFKIVDKYRILSIINNSIVYVFTDVHFNDCKYKFYRISLKSIEKPILKDCQITKLTKIDGNYKKYQIKNLQINENKTKKTTEIKVFLENKVPINKVKINIPYQFDYYRNVEFSVITDSVKTEKGYHKNIKHLTRRQISSLDSNTIDLSTFEDDNYYTDNLYSDNLYLDNLIITIFNEDNPKLKINSIELFGAEIELICRFPAIKNNSTQYFLFYGNDSIYAPKYDLQYFVKDLENIKNEIKLGSEIKNNIKIEKDIEPYIIDKKWLWLIIIIIISIIAVFSIKMLKQSNSNNV